MSWASPIWRQGVCSNHRALRNTNWSCSSRSEAKIHDIQYIINTKNYKCVFKKGTDSIIIYTTLNDKKKNLKKTLKVSFWLVLFSNAASFRLNLFKTLSSDFKYKSDYCLAKLLDQTNWNDLGGSKIEKFEGVKRQYIIIQFVSEVFLLRKYFAKKGIWIYGVKIAPGEANEIASLLCRQKTTDQNNWMR